MGVLEVAVLAAFAAMLTGFALIALAPVVPTGSKAEGQQSNAQVSAAICAGVIVAVVLG